MLLLTDTLLEILDFLLLTVPYVARLKIARNVNTLCLFYLSQRDRLISLPVLLLDCVINGEALLQCHLHTAYWGFELTQILL